MLKQELLNRIKHLQKTMEMHSFDSYIITAEEDIWYFTNIIYKPEERPFFLIISQNQQPVLVVPKLIAHSFGWVKKHWQNAPFAIIGIILWYLSITNFDDWLFLPFTWLV